MEKYKIYGHIPDKDNYWVLFDLDWTLIRPLKYSISKPGIGWKFLPLREQKLKQLDRDGYTIGIVSNQKIYPGNKLEDINKKMIEVEDWLNRLLGHTVPIFVALAQDNYRKPSIGFKNFITPPSSKYRNSIICYVGDAAGRRDDFSDSDIEFAKNMDVVFYTPEQFFGTTGISSNIINIPKLFIIMMGAPGSGKTTYSLELQKYLQSKNSSLVNITALQSDDYSSNWVRIKKELSSYLNNININGGKLIYDATNGKRERRIELLNMSWNLGIPTLIIHILNPGDNRNKLRDKKVPAIAYNTFWSSFDNPDPSSEGNLLEIV